MNIDTNLQTNATDLLPKAKLKFEHDLINIGQNPEKGKPFELFYEKYSQAIAEGKPFQNPAQLQTAVGGRYLKAQIAFNVLESQQSNLDHKLREVPEWFTAPLKAALKLDITALWQSVEQDIATVVENRVKIAEHLSEQRKQQAIQSAELVEELQDKLAELQGLPRQLTDLTHDNDRLAVKVKKLENKASELQDSADTSFSYQRKNAVLEANNAKLKSENQNMRKELERTAALLQETLIKKANLEGRLEERGEFSKITNENTQVKS
ncbi:DNA repair protein [Vibrio parahaemolyticus]|uniref:DNA repair protein n=1 Tax=Vibrio parahaemolyticus TaxID=670 RepID=UPI001121EB24|nr:DNA repair protein [Vibrio parahaemolyticus]MBD2857278.1 DNA repair protein [Vibrio parahaemolyticus]MBW6448868.1 DNA repair protein [Vibrio parahaemolyticus]TPA39099.1 DNA repair protein [Vibrio parahaemolyticus]HAS3130132.1 DNA repair protein [Vibrio parahaemolyticus]HCH5317858.1 DNA repair protein [Vibrio parahaemolyticus]